MLMLAIVAVGMLFFRIGKAADAPLERADRRRRRGARRRALVRDQLIAQVATTGTSDLMRIERAGRARRGRATTQAQPRAARRLQVRRRRRARVGRHERHKVDAPNDDNEGRRRRARARSSWRRSSRSASTSTAAPRPRAPAATPTITDEEWKDLAKDLHKPPTARTRQVLGRLLQEARRDPVVREHGHGRGADAARRRASRRRPSTTRAATPARSTSTTPAGRSRARDRRVRPAPAQARLPHALAGREPLRPHARRRPGQRVAAGFGGGLGAAGSLTRLARRSSWSTGTRRRPAGLAGSSCGGPGGDPVRAAGPEDRDPDLRGARSLQRLRRRSGCRRGRRRSSSPA